MTDWLDAYTAAAHRQTKLPKGWIGYFFEKVSDQGVMVAGVVVTKAISRGPRKGEPNFRAADPTTRRSVFVPHAVADRARARLLKAEGHPS